MTGLQMVEVEQRLLFYLRKRFPWFFFIFILTVSFLSFIIKLDSSCLMIVDGSTKPSIETAVLTSIKFLCKNKHFYFVYVYIRT